MSDFIAQGQANKVLPANRFRNVTDDGKIVESTAPLPARPAQVTKYYASPLENASFHRQDGKRLGFVYGILQTNLFYDQQYLDNEIADGNQYVREATTEEIRAFNYRINPKATMKQEILSDPEVRKTLEDQIIQELLRKAEPGSALAQQLDAMKISGVDSGTSGEASVKTATATMTPLSSSQAAPLGGIVTSKDVKNVSAGN
jgi:predicted DNA-binding protein YlxM (UPF0122 family)